MRRLLPLLICVVLLAPASALADGSPPPHSSQVPARGMFTGGWLTTTVNVLSPGQVRVHVSAAVTTDQSGSMSLSVNGCAEPLGSVCNTVEIARSFTVPAGHSQIGWTVMLNNPGAFTEVGASLFDNQYAGDITATTTLF